MIKILVVLGALAWIRCDVDIYVQPVDMAVRSEAKNGQILYEAPEITIAGLRPLQFVEPRANSPPVKITRLANRADGTALLRAVCGPVA